MRGPYRERDGVEVVEDRSSGAAVDVLHAVGEGLGNAESQGDGDNRR